MRLFYIVGAAAVIALGKMLLEKRARRECELCGLDMGFFSRSGSTSIGWWCSATTLSSRASSTPGTA